MREWAHLAGLLLLELALVLLLLVSGRYLGSVPAMHFASWVKETAPGDAIIPLLRFGALVVSSWLLATSVLYAIVAFRDPAQVPRSARAGWLPPRMVRKVIDGVVAASIVVSSVGSSAGLAAAAPVPAVVAARPPARPSLASAGTARRRGGTPEPTPGEGPLSTPAARPAPVAPAARPTPATRPTPAARPASRGSGSGSGSDSNQAVVNTQVVGRHLPHPGRVDHKVPVLVSDEDPSAPSPTNGFAGLAPGTKVVVVKPGDCLSVIAEIHLGNWQLDHEITTLNLGRIQPDGHALRDEHWIYPGWVLVMPRDAVGTEVVGTAAPENPGPVAGSDARPAPVVGASQTTLAPAPARLAPAPVTVPPASPAATPPTMVAIAADRFRSGAGVDVSALVGAGLVGAAVLGTVELLRRRQAQRRPDGRRIRVPGPALAKSELAVQRAKSPDRTALIERAVASLVSVLRDRPDDPPTILGAVVDADSVEVLLDRPAAAPTPWVTSAEGFRWRIDAGDVALEPRPESAALPALVAVGRVAAGSADALVNLEAAGLVGISGDPADALGLLFAMAAHLQGAPWARACNVVLVGLPPELSTVDHVRTVSSVREVADELRTTAEVMAATAHENSCSDPFTGRIRGLAGDGWPPAVVLSARRLDPDELRLLASIARPGSGVAAVAVNAGALATWDIDAGARPCPINPLRLAVEPTVLDDRAMGAISALIRVAEDTGGVTKNEPPYDRIELSADAPPAEDATTLVAAMTQPQPATTGLSIAVRVNSRVNGVTRPPEVAGAPVMVKVLGSIEVDGALEFKRAKSRELVVYLAMHPGGVGEAELDEALWGSSGARLVAPSTRDATVSVARTALGGPARLLPAQGQGREKRYQLGPDVQSDWAQFCALHRVGRAHQSVAALRDALELVRGRPFQAVVSGRTFGWLHTEGHVRHIEAEVADAADLAAGLYLADGDPMSAKWAARRGLLAEPYTERLWVRLMEAADAVGESQEIERIMDEMDAVLELEGDFSGLHPNTLAAYDRLSRRHRHPSGF